MSFASADEQPHRPGPEPGWEETWTFELWTPDGLGAFTEYTRVPALARSRYWAVLLRPGAAMLHLADLDAPLRPIDLEVRTEGLWCGHVCEAPYEQWTVANEAYAVALDDPLEALGRGYGRVEPVAFDLEWYAERPPEELTDDAGYTQAGTVHAVIEITEGRLELQAPSRRYHRWGPPPPNRPEPPPGWPADGGSGRALLALDGQVVERRLSAAGWRVWRRAP